MTSLEGKEKHSASFTPHKSTGELPAKRGRKDPRSMTTEELEEYINKNKNDNKSLNSSFQSQKNLNYSFTATHKVENNQPNTNETLQRNLANLNYNYLGNTPQLNSTSNVKNPFIKEKNYFKENLLTNQTNISIDNPSDNEDKFLKNKLISNNSNQKIYNESTQNNFFTNSNAANNYLKSLQEKNRILNLENEDLKKSFIELSELLEKERSDFHKKLVTEINKANDIERNLKNELNSLENENKLLVEESNDLRMKLSLLESNVSILENEKSRHLEQNAVEKDNLQNQIESLYREIKETKNRFDLTLEENENFRIKLSKKNEENSNLEKAIQNLKEQFFNLQRNAEDEKVSLLSSLKNLKDNLTGLELEKKEMTKKYERNVRDLTHRLNRLEKDSFKLKDSNNTQLPKKTSQIIKQKKTQSRSQSKEKLTTSNSSSNLLKNSREVKEAKPTKSPIFTKKFNLNYDVSETTLSPKCINSKHKLVKKKKKSVDSKSKNNLKLSQNSNLSVFTEREIISPINKQMSDDLSFNSITNIKSPNHDSNKGEIKSSQLNEINDFIFELERSIVDLNRNYKNMMIKINVFLLLL
jgi:hypothetical protein